MNRLWVTGILIAALGCMRVDDSVQATASKTSDTETASLAPDEDLALATFAGGCFWCVEAPFEKVAGVKAVISGFSGGAVKDPTYKQVCAGGTGHAEVVQIHFAPREITYHQLLEVFWRQINPTDAGGQFVDRGATYRSEIFYHDEAQKKAAEASRTRLGESSRFDKPIVTRITAYQAFYPAEDYHQDYYKKSPSSYQSYRKGSGRDQYLDQVWGKDRKLAFARQYRKPSAEELRQRLTDLQYRVTQEEATEPPFRNEYWDNKAEGIYVDIASGEPLFSSKDKFKSGTGWPSFTRPLVEDNIAQRTDRHLGYARSEVRSKHADSHLGHVFKDGPEPTGLRYCINSAALMFVPREDLEKAGYGAFVSLFEK